MRATAARLTAALLALTVAALTGCAGRTHGARMAIDAAATTAGSTVGGSTVGHSVPAGPNSVVQAPRTSPYPVNSPAPVRTSRLPLPVPSHPSGSAGIAGCPLFPADNPWRRDVSHAALSPRSAAWVASIGSGRFLHPDFGSSPSYGIPYSVVPAGQPKVPVRFTAYGDESDPGPYPIPPTARIEAGGDAHVLVASG
ncbi:MAG TPA: hypothetical protein VFD94_09695, partial [Jatrophihabitans sp.]|nr:hypothetical protein [Jatrophihabitans sp.]